MDSYLDLGALTDFQSFYINDINRQSDLIN